MSQVILSDELAEQLQNIAEHEQRSLEDVLRTMIQQYTPQAQDHPEEADATPDPDPLLGLIGLLGDEIQDTDLSTTVRETLKKYSHPQYGWTKRGRTD